MWDGQVKVITGIRRCGKSYLLCTIFRNYLLEQGVSEDHILTYELDLAKDIRFRNPLELAKVVREQVEGKADQYYLFVDEIQMSDEVPNPYNPNESYRKGLAIISLKLSQIYRNTHALEKQPRSRIFKF